MNHLKNFIKNSGQIVRYYEVFIPKNGGKIKTEYKEMKVLLTNGNNIVIYNQYNKFQMLDIKKKKGSDNSNSVLSATHSYIRNWGSTLFEYNGLVGCLYSYQTENIVKKRVHNALQKLIMKEYGAYSNMADKLYDFLK